MNVTDNKGDHALRERAYALADSGRFANAHEVEQALIAEGWPNVATALGDYARKSVVERCAAAMAH